MFNITAGLMQQTSQNMQNQFNQAQSTFSLPQDFNIFNESNPFEGNVTYDDMKDRIEVANEFLAQNKPDENGIYSQEALKMMSDICVIMDENGTILSQMIDSDHDGKIDTIEYYNEDGFKFDNNADGITDKTREFNSDGSGAKEYDVDEDGNKTLTKEIIYNEDGSKTEIMPNKEKITYSYEFDDDGNPLYEITETDEDGDGVVDKKKRSSKVKHYSVA